MIETILLAILLGKIKGYKIKPIFSCWQIYLVVISALMYISLNIGVFLGNYSWIRFAHLMESGYICAFLFLILKCKLYTSSIIGSIAIFVGTSLNKLAITVNGGSMPVFPSLSYITGYVKPDSFVKVNGIHVLGNEFTKLKFLTDIIDLGYSILSIGDLFIRFFTFIVIYSAIKYVNSIKVNTSCVDS
jgi:hypothetical protein